MHDESEEINHQGKKIIYLLINHQRRVLTLVQG
jgi:hypothetical protein